MMCNLVNILENFRDKVNENENVHALVKNWNPNVIIETLDTEKFYTLEIRDANIERIIEDEINSDHEIKLEADEDILNAIFKGDTNPAEAVLNGELVVFGDPNDQIKLDAITLLIWGM